MSVVLVFMVRELDTSAELRANTANVQIDTTIRRDGRGVWTVVLSVENDGPGTARIVRIQHSAMMTLCTSVVVPSDEGATTTTDTAADYGTGAQCERGSGIVAVEAIPQRERPGLFLHEPISVAFEADVGLSSASARDFLPGETIWLEYTYELSDRLDRELAREIPEDSDNPTSRTLDLFRETFTDPNVTGDRVDPTRSPTRIIEARDATPG